jgi:hypothetical protein
MNRGTAAAGPGGPGADVIWSGANGPPRDFGVNGPSDGLHCNDNDVSVARVLFEQEHDHQYHKEYEYG